MPGLRNNTVPKPYYIKSKKSPNQFKESQSARVVKDFQRMQIILPIYKFKGFIKRDLSPWARKS